MNVGIGGLMRRLDYIAEQIEHNIIGTFPSKASFIQSQLF